MEKKPRKTQIVLEEPIIWSLEVEKAKLPEIVIYPEENFNGKPLRTNCDIRFVGDKLNDKKISVVVISGVWGLFEHEGYRGQLFEKLKPGYYPKINSNNLGAKISSIRCIKV